jgi:hypothetical protein
VGGGKRLREFDGLVEPAVGEHPDVAGEPALRRLDDDTRPIFGDFFLTRLPSAMIFA